MAKAFIVVGGAIVMTVSVALMIGYLVWPSYFWGYGSWQVGAWLFGNLFIVFLSIMYDNAYIKNE